MIARLAPFALIAALAACVPATSEMPQRRAADLPQTLPAMNQFGTAQVTAPIRGNTTMARDFLDLSFQMESGRPIPRLSRFEGPISVAVAPGAPATLDRDLDALIGRLRREAGIDIRRVSSGPANITIETMPRAQMQRVVPQAACFVVPRVASWAEFRANRSSRNLDWTTLEQRDRIAVFIPADVSPQEVRDCLHEEVAQALGPLNDLYRLPDSVFNDDNFNAVLTGFDMLILRTYYDPALRSGMTRDAVARALPGILSRLNPRGNSASDMMTGQTPREWVAAIETALGPGTSDAGRISAAERAVAIAQAQGWTDTRLGFAWFALGRLTLTRDAVTARNAFVQSAAVFERTDPGGIQLAHVQMQLAAFALAQGDAAGAVDLTGAAMPAATRGQNASLLSTILMIRAAALDDLGRNSEAQAVRLDSLAWGRYGFGTSGAVEARLIEVAALSPQR